MRQRALLNLLKITIRISKKLSRLQTRHYGKTNDKENVMTTQVSNPLTLVMNIKTAEDAIEIQKLLAGFESMGDENPINIALTKIGTVHFARFVFLSPLQLAVITSYDGEFTRYIEDFSKEIGDIFNTLLSFMVDAPPLPVQNNLKDFMLYIQKNDRSFVDGELQPLYSAYPTLSVQDILANAGENKLSEAS